MPREIMIGRQGCKRIADLARLAQKPQLQEGIAAVLKTLSDSRPGEIGRRMSTDLTEKMQTGVYDG